MSIFPVAGPAGRLDGFGRVDSTGHDEPALILVHGIQGTASSWQGVLSRLSAVRTVVAPNLRGRAGSTVPDELAAYALDHFAADLHAVVASLARPVVLVGWSMGVLVILEYVQRYGFEGVRGLSLLSGTACPGTEARWFLGQTAEEIADEAQRRAERMNLRERASDKAVAGAWMAVRSADYRALLPGICVPTLVVHGTDDDQCPLTHGRLLGESIPDSRFLVHEGGGHNLMAQSPGTISEQLGAFYAEHCRTIGAGSGQ